MDDLASVAAELRLIAKGFRQLRLAHAKVELAVHRKPLCRRALVNPPQSLRPPMANRERFISGKALEIAPAEWHPKSLRPAELRFYAGGAPAVNSAGEPMFVDGGLSSRVQGYCSGEHVAAIEDELGRANEWAKRHARVWLGLAPPYGSVMVEGFAWPEVVIRVAESAGLSVLKKPDWMFVVPSNGAHCSVDLWRARKEFDFQYTPEDEAVVGDEPEFVWYTFPSIVRDSELAAGWLAERLEKIANPDPGKVEEAPAQRMGAQLGQVAGGLGIGGLLNKGRKMGAVDVASRAMFELLQANPDRYGWTLEEWVHELSRGKKTILKTEAWAEIKRQRAANKEARVSNAVSKKTGK